MVAPIDCLRKCVMVILGFRLGNVTLRSSDECFDSASTRHIKPPVDVLQVCNINQSINQRTPPPPEVHVFQPFPWSTCQMFFEEHFLSLVITKENQQSA